MPAYKNERDGTWYVKVNYRDWTNTMRYTTKRGFPTKREALQWEAEFKRKVTGEVGMFFESFAEIYLADVKTRVKESTFITKESIVRKHLIPYFGKMPLQKITSKTVMKWQNVMMSEKGFTKSYLKTIHNQLSTLFNHAIKHYGLQVNPAQQVGNMGSDKDIDIHYWTLEQYRQFADVMMDFPLYYYCFEVLYWCGMREGEMLALTPADVDFEKKTIRISKTFQHLNGRDYMSEPKTRKSKRVITIPDFLCSELKDYLDMVYEPDESERLFPISKSSLIYAMKKGVKLSGLPDIRVHDLRHSHVSLLIDQGYSAVAIAERVGHESVEITYRYAHMFPSVQNQMANTLDSLAQGGKHE